jgi:CDP-4-dehydro-6-deoxyglucose reductase, E3
MRIPPTFEARLTFARMLASNVRELRFERTDGEPFDFVAGQWVSVHAPAPGFGGDDPVDIKRAYSIASAPNGTPAFELAVTHVEGGPGSTFLHTLPIGATLNVIGPQGFFVRPLERATPSLFVATGTGLTPLRSMIHAAIAAKSTMPMSLLFGIRTEEDILYRTELEELAARHPTLRIAFTLSRADGTWAGRRGYVQSHARELFTELEALGAGRPHVYACGLARMVTAVRDLLRKEMQLPRELVHTERYD